MPLRSPSGICSASANGSPEVIQEFVVRESSRKPHCQLDRPASAATSSPFSHTCPHCLPFPTRHSGKAQCQRRALASTPLAGDQLLKTVYRMAQHLRLARERRFNRRGKSSGSVFYLRNGDSGPFCPHSAASLSSRGFATKRVDSGIYCLLFHFRCLVRLSFHFIQTSDQNF
jgi:hypothetical protein